MKIMNLALLCVVISSVALIFVSCSKVEEGSSVLPTVSATCTTSSCKVNGTPYFYSFTSASGCNGSSIAYDLRATGVATASCNASSGCTARVTNWTDQAGNPITQIKDSSYDVCNVFFVNGITRPDPVDEYASSTHPKQVLRSQSFNSSQTQINLSAFADQ